MENRKYNKTYIMLPCAGSKEDRNRWKAAALEADMTFEVYVGKCMETVSSGRCVHPARQTPDSHNPVTDAAKGGAR